MWEYMTVNDVDVDQLNLLGAEGWEVIGITSTQSPSDPGASRRRNGNIILLKRAI